MAYLLKVFWPPPITGAELFPLPELILFVKTKIDKIFPINPNVDTDVNKIPSTTKENVSRDMTKNCTGNKIEVFFFQQTLWLVN